MVGQVPDPIRSEADLDEVLTRPGPALIEFIRSVRSPLLLLGASGKMGPTLARLAVRAAALANHPLEVIAVSRFTHAASREWLESFGVRTLSCDLLDPNAPATLPNSPSVVHLVGRKFGTAQDPSTTWAVNTLVPAAVVRRFPSSRIVVVSTGNVYPPAPVSSGGAREEDPLTPRGEYANAAVARERLFAYAAGESRTPLVHLRLFYAVELRYGVLVDIARRVFAGEPVPLANGWVSCVWQGDANDRVLRALGLADFPPTAWNLCLPEPISVRAAALRFAGLFGIEPHFEGLESETSLIGNSSRLCGKLGRPEVDPETMMGWIADWVRKGGRSWNKPTHFEVRDGSY